MEKNYANVIPNGTCSVAHRVKIADIERARQQQPPPPPRPKKKQVAIAVPDRYKSCTILESEQQQKLTKWSTYADAIKMRTPSPPSAEELEIARKERVLVQSKVDTALYGDNPYRVHNYVDRDNCAVFIDHIEEWRMQGLGTFHLPDDRRAYWEETAKQYGTVTRFYWHEQNNFAIVTMATHEDAVTLFNAVGDWPWDMWCNYDWESVLAQYIKIPFARWYRSAGSHPLTHVVPGARPSQQKLGARRVM